MKHGGAERRLTSTQFGFRSGCGTADAIFAVRRHIDLALARRGGRVGMVALDWRMAFDAINVDALLLGLRIFGLPEKVLRLIQHIYSDRRFRASEDDHFSSWKRQHSGISQGCPLSPFLFVMLMTVVIHDAISELNDEASRHHIIGELLPLLHADDTLIISEHVQSIQECLNKVADVGARFGFALHWSKFQLLQVNGIFPLHAPDGTQISATKHMTYLGTNIYADGNLHLELSAKLGRGWADFTTLNTVCKHS